MLEPGMLVGLDPAHVVLEYPQGKMKQILLNYTPIKAQNAVYFAEFASCNEIKTMLSKEL
jgi:hypothetical protein